MVATELMHAARAGDDAAFQALVAPHLAELRVHCYRMLGSVQDAEDVLQETLLAAWRGLDGFAGRAELRTWLYRIATNRCLNALRSAGRRPRIQQPWPNFEIPEPTGTNEVTWLEPFPDSLLGTALDTPASPEARYEAKEAVSLAFMTAVQLLPPRQRAVLVLRDVLAFSANEVAQILHTTENAVTSALNRARAALADARRASAQLEPPPRPGSPVERHLIERLTAAFTAADVDGLVGLLTEDVRLAMPPLPPQYQGRELAARFLAMVTFRHGRTYRLAPVRANGQPAFGLYVREGRVRRANGLMVVSLAGAQICGMTRFENSVLPRFGLPPTLPD